MPLPDIADFQPLITDLVSNKDYYFFATDVNNTVVSGEQITLEGLDTNHSAIWPVIAVDPADIGNALYALKITHNVPATCVSFVTVENVSTINMAGQDTGYIYFVPQNNISLTLGSATSPFQYDSDYYIEILRYEGASPLISNSGSGAIIYNVLQETAAASGRINFYGHGPEAYLENIDNLTGSPAHADKFPVFWVYGIKLNSKPLSDSQPLPLDRVYRIRAVLATQFQFSGNVNDLVDTMKEMLAACTQFEINIKNHAAVDPDKPLVFDYDECIHMYSDNLVGYWVDITLSIREHLDNNCTAIPTDLEYVMDGYVGPDYVAP